MTAQAAGRFWRQATPEQQKQLSAEFRTLLIYTYAGALSQIKNETIEFKPFRADPADTEVEVKSQVNLTRGEPITLNYRLSKGAQGWKIFDLNVMGAWLVETYKSDLRVGNRQERRRWPDQEAARPQPAAGQQAAEVPQK
jgi:phospholipid transport system substrate-binding protein